MNPRKLTTLMFVVLFLGGVSTLSGQLGGTATAAPQTKPALTPGVTYRGVSTAERFDVSPPLRELALLSKPDAGPVGELPERASGLEGALGPQDRDAAVQGAVGFSLIPSPTITFTSIPNISTTGPLPPDPVGDVGPNHYVSMVNSRYAVHNKSGTLLVGPANINTLFAGFGGACQNENAGDPIVLHDQLADRWILTQFTSAGPTFFNCVAVSTTPDPTGSYFRYAFGTGSNFPDYPKYGIWPDALFISTREFLGTAGAFQGVGAYAVNRAQLIAGNPTPQVISFLAAPGSTPYNLGDGLLPSDLDGTTLPPANSPNYFVGTMDNGGPYGAPQDAITLWKFVVDFVTPANSSFTLANTIPVAAFDSIFPCSGRQCIPQPGTTTRLDILSYRQRPMWRLAYRNFGTHESLVTNQSVEAGTLNGAAIAGIRWYEIRSPNTAPTIFQQGTYAPGLTDGIHRWMGSIAMDVQGNMALGYSVSSATVFPGIRYSGRLVADPLNTLPQGEGTIINGTGSQTSTAARWGDYTSMNVDPVDDCTFWYINEFIPVTSPSGWQAAVGSFKYPNCVAGPTAVQVAALDQAPTTPLRPLLAGLAGLVGLAVTAGLRRRLRTR